MSATVAPESEMPPGAGAFYEVVDGRVVEPPEMGAIESYVASLIADAIAVFFANTARTGRSAVETLFRLDPKTNRQRRPELAYVSYERWPKDRPVPWSAAWEVVPDLAVEVISPGDLAVEVLEKIDDYFRAGVRQVWVFYPRHGRVFVQSPTRGVTTLARSDILDGGEVLPGFRLRLAELFEEGKP